MTLASTGIPGLDDTIDHLRIGDNVVWQVDSKADFAAVAEPFVGRALAEGRRVLYLSFGQRPPLLDDLAGSLRRLHTDHVDLWQLHAWGGAPLEESLAAIDQAVNAGMVRYAGVSNFVGWQTAQAATWPA